MRSKTTPSSALPCTSRVSLNCHAVKVSNLKCKLVGIGARKGRSQALEDSQTGLESAYKNKWLNLKGKWWSFFRADLAEWNGRFPSWAGAESSCTGFEFWRKNGIWWDWSKTLPDMIATDQPWVDFILWSYSRAYAIQPKNPLKNQNTVEYIAGKSFHSFPGTDV